MNKSKDGLVFYRTKNGSLVCFDPNQDKKAYQKRKKTAIHRGPLRREMNNRSRFKDVEEETVRFNLKGKKRLGKFSMADDVLMDKERKNDRDTARDVYQRYGGEMYIRGSHEHEENEPNPDYNWNKRLWDGKKNEKPTKNAVKQSVRTGIHQISDNPGGIIIEPHKDMPIHEAKKHVRDRLRESALPGTRALVKRNGKIKAVWRKK